MSYLKYGGQYVKTDGSFLGNYVVAPTFGGVFDFDGSAYVTVTPSGGANTIEGNKIITWDMWLDQESGYLSNTCILNLIANSPPVDDFKVDLTGDTITVGSNWVDASTYSLSGLGNTILSCEAKKASGKSTYFKINSVTQTPTGSGVFGGALAWRIGWGTNYLVDATVWNVKVYDYTPTELESFPGYPDGDTNAAWGASATVINPNGSGTRDIY